MLHLPTAAAELTQSTKLRKLGLKERNKLTAILSISHCWKDLAAVIRNPDDREEHLYSAQDIDILDRQPNPAAAFFENWSTTGRVQPNLRDLLGVLREAHLLRAVHFVQHELLKGENKEEEAVTEELETVLHLVMQQDEATSNIDSIVDQLQGIDISDLTLYPFEELSTATRNFCNLKQEQGGCKIGEGSYGSVYKATILGVAVAVKQLKDAIDKQFFTELSILVRCKHENLLSLLGCSVNGPKCCLVYEYMPNGSLQDRLACIGNSPPLSSVTRLLIAYGSALGINYLHTFGETPMVHRDIKSANILLDKNLIPKIGDFGLVRIGSSNGSSSTMAVTENVYGTCVYMANEAFFGDVSVKLDTFSFGVVLLELLTGLPPYDTAREERDLITHMESCDDILEMLDSKVIWNSDKAVNLYNISKLCVIRTKKKRPTIFEILPDLSKCCLEFSDVEQWV